MSTFSDRLKKLRDSSGQTQAQIAESIGITPQAFSYYINGREPNYETLTKIANYFNVSIDYLLGKSQFKTPEELHSINVECQSFLELFSEYQPDLLRVFISNMNKFLRIENVAARRAIIWNISLLVGFHRRILDVYNSYFKMASEIGNTASDDISQVELPGYSFPSSASVGEILFLIQNSFNSEALEEAAYIYEETQKMVCSLYEEICKQNNLAEKYSEKHKFKYPPVTHYPYVNLSSASYNTSLASKDTTASETPPHASYQRVTDKKEPPPAPQAPEA